MTLREQQLKAEKYFGHKVIKHPDGYYYLVLYLCEEKKLSNSELKAVWRKH